MNLTVLSLNFKQAPVEIRERLDIPASQLSAMMAEIRHAAGMDELLVLSTCNRVEFYFVTEDESRAVNHLNGWLAAKMDDPGIDLDQAAIVLSHRAALIHLFRVTCSLESMVVGEPQILGQVKDAYQAAVNGKHAGPVFTGLMPRVLHGAKRVRTETQIARHAVSISYAAVELATKIFDSLEEKTVLVIGAGEMAELAIGHLLKQGIRRLMITNRTFAHAVALAEKYQGDAIPFNKLEEALPGADIVISSTGARKYIIDKELARAVMRQRKGDPMFFIDIAVPRDIDPAVNDVSNVYCYDIDDLKQVIDANRKERENEAMLAQEIVEEEVARYLRWFDSLSAVPAIKALRQNFHAIGERELDKTLSQLPHLKSRDAQQVRRLVHGLVNKLLHHPSTALKQLAQDGDGRLYSEAITALFGLESSPPAGTRGKSADIGPEAEGEEAIESNKVVPFPIG